jgi:hypothetical protein
VFQEAGAMCSINAVTGTAAAGWSSPQFLSGDCFTYLQFAMNSHGEAALTWGATALQGGPVVVITRDASGSWGAPVTVSPAYYRQVLPDVAIGEDGTAMVLWAKYTALTWSRRARGAQWSPPEPSRTPMCRSAESRLTVLAMPWRSTTAIRRRVPTPCTPSGSRETVCAGERTQC